MKKTILKTMHQAGAFAPFRWASRKKVLILTYHRFGSAKDGSRVSAEAFGRHLSYLKEHHNVMPLADTVEHLRQGKPLPPNTAVITIDDGYRDAYDIAFPLLKKFGLPATVYAITDFLDGRIWLWTDLMRYVLLNAKADSIKIAFGPDDTVEARLTDDVDRLEAAGRINSRLKKLPNIEKEAKIKQIADELNVVIPALPTPDFAPMTWEQAREMEAEGIRIESHSVTHPVLTKVEQGVLDHEMRTSKRRLEEILDREVRHFCYPNGTLDPNVRAAAKNAGYTSAVTTAYGFNDPRTDHLLMNRIDAQSAIENFVQSTSGFEAFRQRVF